MLDSEAKKGPVKGAKALTISVSVVRLEKLVQSLCPEDRVANTTMTPPSSTLKIDVSLLHLTIVFVCLCVRSSMYPSTRPVTVRSFQRELRLSLPLAVSYVFACGDTRLPRPNPRVV